MANSDSRPLWDRGFCVFKVFSVLGFCGSWIVFFWFAFWVVLAFFLFCFRLFLPVVGLFWGCGI